MYFSERAREPAADGWGSRGRRFTSCQPDRRKPTSWAISGRPGAAPDRFLGAFAYHLSRTPERLSPAVERMRPGTPRPHRGRCGRIRGLGSPGAFMGDRELALHFVEHIAQVAQSLDSLLPELRDHVGLREAAQPQLVTT